MVKEAVVERKILAQSLRQDDPQAWEKFYLDSIEPFDNFVFTRVPGPPIHQDRADIFHKALMKVWGARERIDAEIGNPYALLCITGARTAIDHHRSKEIASTISLEATVIRSNDPDNNFTLKNIIPNMQTTLPDVQAIENASTTLIKEHVQAAISQLPPEQAEVIRYELVGKTQREIAEITGSPLGTVKTHARRAKIKLRGVLADFAAELFSEE